MLLLATILLTFSCPTFAQWTPTTGGIYLAPTSDKLGIGLEFFSAKTAISHNYTDTGLSVIMKIPDPTIIPAPTILPKFVIRSYDPWLTTPATYTNNLIFDANNNLGIGPSTTPLARLDVQGPVYGTLAVFRQQSATNPNQLFVAAIGSSGYQYNPIAQSGDLGIIWNDQDVSSAYNSTAGLVLAPRISSTTTPIGIRIAADGDVGIGESNPTAKLFVRGTLTATDQVTLENARFVVKDWGSTPQLEITTDGRLSARQIDVHLDAIPPDYVFHAAFDKDSALAYAESGLYELMTLQELAQYVQAHRHLPGIKSAAEYQRQGSVNVGELQLQLLEKVEELTLYNIELMKQMEALKARLAELEEAQK